MKKNIIFKKKQIEKAESEKTKCYECRHWIDIEDAQKVIYVYLNDSFLSSKYINYYCPMHKRSYHRIEQTSRSKTYHKLIPEHYIEVTEKGQKIKKK